MARLPTHTSARAVREIAERRGLTYTDTIAELVRIGLEHFDEFALPTTHDQQEALPLKAS